MTTDFRIDIIRNRVKIGELKATQARIDFDQNREVMRSMAIEAHGTVMNKPGTEFNMFRDRLRPVLITDNGEKALGIFMIMSAPRTISDIRDETELQAFDETMIAKQAYFETRRYYASGTTYLQIIEGILTELGLTNIYAEDTDAAITEDLEIAPDENCLEKINDMLDAMNYQHLYADESGTINIRRVKEPTAPDFIYREGQTSGIIAEMTEETDIYNLPNVVVGIYSSPTISAPLVYKKTNDDPGSAISTVSRGYKVVKVIELWNSATQEDLEAYVERIAYEAMQATETVTFMTQAEDGHEPNTAVQIDSEKLQGLFVDKSWTMNIAVGTYRMTHKAERKVFV